MKLIFRYSKVTCGNCPHFGKRDTYHCFLFGADLKKNRRCERCLELIPKRAAPPAKDSIVSHTVKVAPKDKDDDVFYTITGYMKGHVVYAECNVCHKRAYGKVLNWPCVRCNSRERPLP